MPRSTLTQRADGRYRCWYRGRQFYGSTMREAYAKRDAYKRAAEAGENPDRIIVRVYAEYWLPVAKGHTAPNTYRTCKHIIDILCDELGDTPLSKVRATDIKAVYNRHFFGLSDAYITHARYLYQSMFDAAIADGYIRINPARQKAAAPPRGYTGTHRAITAEERHIIETCATDHRVHPVAMLMMYAGLRPAEAQALDMADVDFEHMTIHVHATYHFADEHINQRIRNDDMKTTESDRVVPLFSPLADCLRGRTGLIIEPVKQGESMSRSAWSRAWQSYRAQIERELNGVSRGWYGKSRAQIELAEAGELPPWRDFAVVPYDLRHTFCTWCRDTGVELHTCIAWMGHSDATMTMKIYDEVTDDRVRAQMERVEEAIRAQKKG